MSALLPLFALLFLGLMGWVLLRLIGGPGGPETFNPNSCCSRSGRQGVKEESDLAGHKTGSVNQPQLTRFRVASGHHRLSSPR